jgi:L-alanine-DL-glutamate epimerase-like enolase superfamily enzyme
MNIERVTVDVLETPVESAYTAAGNQVSSNFHVLARIFTDDGMQGIGFDVVLRPTLVKSMAQTCQELGQLLVGMNVLETEAARAKLERAIGWAGTAGTGGLVNMAIAMWDAKGKVLRQPLYRLLGGHKDRVRAYASDALWYTYRWMTWPVPPKTTLP